MLCNDSGNTAQKKGDRGKRTDGPKKDMNAFRNLLTIFTTLNAFHLSFC